MRRDGTTARAAPVPADGVYPFSFAHKVETSWGEAFVRSEGRIRIPSKGSGAPAFVGEFLVPKRGTLPRPALTALEIHAVEGGLFSRLEPMLGSRLPADFGRSAELADTLMWRTQPRRGVDGHPLLMALETEGPGAPRHLGDHLCPPDWDAVYRGGSRTPVFAVGTLYGGLASQPIRERSDPIAFVRDRLAEGPPEILEPASLDGRLAERARLGGDALRREILSAVEGGVALVGDEVMLRTPEPCWKLTMARGGDLRLDLHLSRTLGGGTNLEPAMFFAIDEREALDAAIEALRAAGRSGVRTRGRLDAHDPSACSIDGRATSLVHLAAGLRESLHHAAKLLPGAAAAAAIALRDAVPDAGIGRFAAFVTRGAAGNGLDDVLREGWDRLAFLAGDALSEDAASPWLARLAGHGAVLRLLAKAPGYGAEASAGPRGPR